MHLIPLILLLIVATSFAAKSPPPVTVRKCCPFNQELRVLEHLATNSVLEAVQCVPSNTSQWVPRIKFKKRDGFFEPQGSKPPFMSFDPNRLPLDSCSDPMHSSGPQGVYLITDGSLYVHDRRLLIPNSGRFCVDRESAIYCLPEDLEPAPRVDPELDVSVSSPSKWQRRRTTVRKCCGQGWAYDSAEKTCVHLTNPTNPLHGKPVFDQSLLRKTRLDTLYGFPTSCEHPSYAILGTFKQEMFDEERNLLRMENSDRELREDEFCLEHMVARENETMYSSFVTVFTCSEFFPTGQPEQNEVPRVSRGKGGLGI